MNSAHLAILHPRLLSSLVLFEPIVHASGSEGKRLAYFSSIRQDLWPSRGHAEAAFRKNKIHGTWDPRVLDRWLRYGLRQLPTKLYPSDAQSPETVTLTTTKHQEGWTYVGPVCEAIPGADQTPTAQLSHNLLSKQPFYRAEPELMLAMLPFLRPRILYVFGQLSLLSPLASQEELLTKTGIGVGGSGGVVAGSVEKIVLNDLGHLLTMEDVPRCAKHAAQWLDREFQKYLDGDGDDIRGPIDQQEYETTAASPQWKLRIKEAAATLGTRQWKL